MSRRRYVSAALVALLVITEAVAAEAQVVVRRDLQYADVVEALRSGMSESRLASLAAQRCLGFEIDNRAAAALQREGATTWLVDRLRTTCRAGRASTVPATSRTTGAGVSAQSSRTAASGNESTTSDAASQAIAPATVAREQDRLRTLEAEKVRKDQEARLEQARRETAAQLAAMHAEAERSEAARDAAARETAAREAVTRESDARRARAKAVLDDGLRQFVSWINQEPNASPPRFDQKDAAQLMRFAKARWSQKERWGVVASTTQLDEANGNGVLTAELQINWQDAFGVPKNKRQTLRIWASAVGSSVMLTTFDLK